MSGSATRRRGGGRFWIRIDREKEVLEGITSLRGFSIQSIIHSFIDSLIHPMIGFVRE